MFINVKMLHPLIFSDFFPHDTKNIFCSFNLLGKYKCIHLEWASHPQIIQSGHQTFDGHPTPTFLFTSSNIPLPHSLGKRHPTHIRESFAYDLSKWRSIEHVEREEDWEHIGTQRKWRKEKSTTYHSVSSGTSSY